MSMQQIGDCTLYQGDCLQIMPTLGQFDACITSPPYDNLRDYGPEFNGVDCCAVIERIAALLMDGGVCMWNVADATVNGSETGSSFKQALYAMQCGLRLHDTMIYIKDNVPFPEAVRYFPGFEYMFVFSRGAPKTFNPLRDRPNKWHGTSMHGTDRQRNGETHQISGKRKVIAAHGTRFNYWRMTNNGPSVGHPAPMPYAMAHDHAQSWTNPGDEILDPFAGSGTTGVACVKLGRKFTGIELDARYFDIACKRIEAAYAQPDMFVEPPAKPKQEALL